MKMKMNKRKIIYIYIYKKCSNIFFIYKKILYRKVNSKNSNLSRYSSIDIFLKYTKLIK